MRAILGLMKPTAGTTRVNGGVLATHPAALTQVGALLDARGVHPGRTLYLSESTVKTHVGHVLMGLGVRDRIHAVVFGYEAGIVAPGGQGETSGVTMPHEH